MLNSTPQQDRELKAFLLSRSELQAILALAEIAIFPGLTDGDPIGDLTPEQEAYGIVCGERALRARGLAFVDEQGDLRIQNDLLEAIGVCAYALNMLVVTHLSSTQNVGRQYVVFHLDNHYISQFLPENVLHLFTVYGLRSRVGEEICRLCPQSSTVSLEKFVVSESSLDRIRNSKIIDASGMDALLEMENIPLSPGRAFLTFFQSPHELIILQAAQRLDADSVELQTVTILYNTQSMWIMSEQEPAAENQETLFSISVTSKIDVSEMISTMNW